MPLTLRALPGRQPLPTAVVPDHGHLVIGRAGECGLVLADPLNRISARHCRIEGGHGGFMLVDTSTNGTQVNERPMAGPHRLAEGDVIGIGDFRLRASIGPARAPVMNLDSWGQPVSPGAPANLAAPATSAATAGPVTAPPPAARSIAADAPAAALLAAAGLPRAAVPVADAELLRNAGLVLATLVDGMAAASARRARARADLGLPPGPPAPAPEALFARLLAPGGVAEAQQWLADAERHERAGLYAMQGALRRTLDALAPAGLRARTKGGPAALWQAYETAFAGSGSDPAFIERFAGELAAAYAAIPDTK